jgi:ubiquitin-protein ligase
MELNKITLKRINGDFKKFTEENPSHFDVYPNPENILEIYFLLVGREKTNYEGGLYIGKIVHSPEYPRKAPDYYVYTPNGRFEINKKICLTNSAYHQADWAPAAWNLITLLEGFASVWHSDIPEDKVGISHISNTSSSELKRLAQESINFNTEKMNSIFYNFPKFKNGILNIGITSESKTK